MSHELAKIISGGKEMREQIEKDIGTALVFARLELAELKAGIRSPLDCPGIEDVAEYIQQKKDEFQEVHEAKHGKGN